MGAQDQTYSAKMASYPARLPPIHSRRIHTTAPGSDALLQPDTGGGWWGTPRGPRHHRSRKPVSWQRTAGARRYNRATAVCSIVIAVSALAWVVCRHWM